MDSGSESDQDSACSSSGEEAQYNSSRGGGGGGSQSLAQQQQQQQAANSSQHAAAVAAEYQSMMKYMQQQQQQQQNDQSRQDEQSQHQQQQPMMMIPTNCLPFMVPSVSSYQMMMQSQAGMPSFFGQNATSSPSSRESEAATGSPLNLQTTREDRPSSRSRPVDFQNQSMAQQQFTHDQQQQQVLPQAARAHQVANASQSTLSRSSPQSGLPSSLPSTMSMSHHGISQDHQMAQQTQQSAGNFSLDFSMVGQRQEPPKPEHPAPPKRPLTPYMRFSKCMWQQVKSTNPSMSVCEIGATIGRMWRELPNEEKQKHNEDFTLDKVRYDTELKSYLKSTGLHASDLVKSKNKKKEIPAKAPVRRPAPPQPPRPAAAANLDSHQVSNQQQQHQPQHLSQSLLGLQLPGMGGTLPMGVGVSMGMLPGFPQMWAAPGQQYPSQQMLASMNMAGQLQFAQQQAAQGLYNNGGATSAEQGTAASQLTSGTEGSQLPPVYLYSPGYM